MASPDLETSWLTSYQVNLAELEDYYHGQHRTTMLTDKQRENSDYQRFWAPVNLCRVVVDEPVGYLARGRFETSVWGKSFYKRRVLPALPELIRWQGLYGEAYLYLWTDYRGLERGLKVRPLPPVEGGKLRVRADYGEDDEITSATISWRSVQPGAGEVATFEIELTREWIRTYRRERERRVLLGAQNNTARVIPLVAVRNPTPSDLLDLIPLQDDLNKLYFDLRQAREYHGFPMLAGPHPQAKLDVGPGRVVNGDLSRIEPGDLSQMLDGEKRIVERAAMLTSSLALHERNRGDPSGIALRYLQQALEAKLAAKASYLGRALSEALAVAARIVGVEPRLREIEGRPEPAPAELIPRLPSEEAALTERTLALLEAGLLTPEAAKNALGVM